MTQCRYATAYSEIDTGNMQLFMCDEQSVPNSSFCKFHDSVYITTNPDDITASFILKVRDAISRNIPLICIGYNLPAVLLVLAITVPANFARAKIGDANFIKTVFENKVNFFNTTFGNVSFSDCTFSDQVSFFATKFEQFVSFNGTKFNGVNFTKTIFGDRVDFTNAKFYNKSIFNTAFPRNVLFTEALFEDVNFSYSTFEGQVDFQNAKFENEAKFSICKFNDRADFSNTRFEAADFLGSTFMELTNFDTVTFNRDVSFSNAKFNESRFIDVTFKGQAQFIGSSFTKANFHKTTFLDMVYFSFSHFIDEANFSEVNFKKQTHFNRITIDKPDRILFDGDLSQVSFIDSDISRVRFSDNVSWVHNYHHKIYEEDLLERYLVKRKAQQMTRKLLIYSGNRYFSTRKRLAYHPPDKQFIDKIFANNKTDSNKQSQDHQLSQFELSLIKRTKLESIIAIYRNLRENYEYYLKYEDAGKCFIREKELKRNYKEIQSVDGYQFRKKNWFSRNFSFAGFYYHLARYGESYYQPFGWAILIIISSMMYFWFLDLQNVQQPYTYQDVDFRDDFKRSLTDFVFVVDLENKNLSDYVVRILSLPILGSFFIALRRKLERRFRH